MRSTCFRSRCQREATERYIAALAELQDVLGELNDLTVAENALAGIGNSSALHAFVNRNAANRSRELVTEAEQGLSSLREIERPWA